MTPSLQCENTQKLLSDDTLPKKVMGHDAIIAIRKYSTLLSDDTHIAFCQKRQWEMIPSLSYENTKNLLSDDTPIAFLPKKAMGHDAIIAM